MSEYELCPDAWRLYDIVCKLEDEEASVPKVEAAWNLYIEHRRKCADCPYPRGVEIENIPGS